MSHKVSDDPPERLACVTLRCFSSVGGLIGPAKDTHTWPSLKDFQVYSQATCDSDFVNSCDLTDILTDSFEQHAVVTKACWIVRSLFQGAAHPVMGTAFLVAESAEHLWFVTAQRVVRNGENKVQSVEIAPSMSSLLCETVALEHVFVVDDDDVALLKVCRPNARGTRPDYCPVTLAFDLSADDCVDWFVCGYAGEPDFASQQFQDVYSTADAKQFSPLSMKNQPTCAVPLPDFISMWRQLFCNCSRVVIARATAVTNDGFHDANVASGMEGGPVLARCTNGRLVVVGVHSGLNVSSGRNTFVPISEKLAKTLEQL